MSVIVSVSNPECVLCVQLGPFLKTEVPTYCWKAPHQQHLPCIHSAMGVLLGTYHSISLAHFVG